MIIKSDYPDPPPLPAIDFVSMLLSRMATFGDKVAVINSVTDERFAYEEMSSIIHKTGNSLYNDLNLRKGDVILMLCPNCPEYLFAVLGALSIGVVVASISPLCTIGEATNYMNECNPKYIITSKEYALKFKKVCEDTTSIMKIITIGEVPGCISFHSLMISRGKPIPGLELNNRQDIALLPLSSGTTGKPKGVMLTHANLQCYLLQSTIPGIRTFAKDRHPTMLLFLPLYHIYAFMQAMSCFHNGGCLVVMPKYNLHIFVNNVKQYQATYLPIVPPTVVQLTKHTEVKTEDFDTVKMFSYGGAPVGADIEEEFIRKFPKQIKRQGYGLTETAAGLIRTPEDGNTKPGATGKVMPGIEARIVDPDTLKDCNTGEDGEIWCRGGVIMKGYYNNPAETSQVLTEDGWFRTGDIGHVDKDGYFYIVDRLKELIKYNAFQVAPAELESLLLGHPCVADCAVVGVPDYEAGELPRAYVVLKPGKQSTEKEIKDFISDQVSPFKRLRGGVVFTDSIPKSPSGKILRRVLKEQIKKEIKSKL